MGPSFNLAPAINAAKGLTEAIRQHTKALEHANKLKLQDQRDLRTLHPDKFKEDPS